MVRAFIAIELPKVIREKLAEIQDELKKSRADVKWVDPGNIHLTLKFLGERDDKKIREIGEVLEEVAAKTDAYAIRLSALGAFPRVESPRVLWVGLDTGEAQTKDIADKLESGIALLGIPKEDRPFSSHITIGRTRSGENIAQLSGLLEALEKKPQEYNLGFEVKKITLYKSTLTPAGPVYAPIKEVSLKAI